MLIQTELANCRLRTWCAADKPALIRNANNRNVWRNLADVFPHPYTEADADDWLRQAVTVRPSVQLAIEWGGEVVGGIGAVAGEGIFKATAEFGYWLGEPHWGQGIATAAARALVGRLMQERRFARLQATVFVWNPASMRVLEKAGFEREAVLRNGITKDGQLIDGVLYAYLADADSNRRLA